MYAYMEGPLFFPIFRLRTGHSLPPEERHTILSSCTHCIGLELRDIAQLSFSFRVPLVPANGSCVGPIHKHGPKTSYMIEKGLLGGFHVFLIFLVLDPLFGYLFGSFFSVLFWYVYRIVIVLDPLFALFFCKLRT